MNLALFFDTETTGLPLWNEPSEDDRQPHLVQLAANLVDLDTRLVLNSLDVIVKPDGWEIPEEVVGVHGITTEMAMDVGVSESVAVDMFVDLWANRLRIAHNESFDARIMRIAFMRYRDRFEPELEVPLSDTWKAGRTECTQLLATPICKIPPTAKMVAAKRFHHKSANLGEAYKHFTGKDLVGAHRAMVDVEACQEVYFAIKAGSTGYVAPTQEAVAA